MSERDKLLEVTQRIAKELADQGLIIKAGWQLYRVMALRDVHSIAELDRLEEIWRASAHHLFSTMMQALDQGDIEPTEADLSRMDQLARENEDIRKTLMLKYGRAMGSA